MRRRRSSISSSAAFNPAEIIDRFKLGYANRTLCLHLPASNRAAGDAQRTRLKELGILRNQKPGHEHFNGSLVVPVFNLSGEVVEMYGRKITSSLREGTPLHLYLQGEHRGVWNEEALIASKDIILCEALIDAMTFWCAGYRQVTASYGVTASQTIIGARSRSTAPSGCTSPTTATMRATAQRRSCPRS